MKRLAILLACLALPACAGIFGGPASAQAPDPAKSWVTLGTSGGPQVQRDRAQIANALVLEDGTYLFDSGNDVQRQMAHAGLAENDVRAIFLSHHHLDHVADLGPLLWTHWTFGSGILTVIGPVGTKDLVDGLIAASGPITLAGYPTGGPAKPSLAELVRVMEIPPDLAEPLGVYRDNQITVEAVGVDHYQSAPSIDLEALPQAVAYRITTPDRVIVYTGDSGPSARLADLVKGADLLVSEVVELDAIRAQLERGLAQAPAAVRQGIVAGMSVNHLTAGEIGKMAAAGQVGSVVLTHFVPVPQNVADISVYGRAIAGHFSGPVTLAEDLGRY